MTRVNKEDIVAYARRDWKAIARLKAEHWEAVRERAGRAEGIRIADELRRQVRLSHPDWPTPEERRDDLDTHARTSEKLKSAILAGRG
jgi:hypothetical protein